MRTTGKIFWRHSFCAALIVFALTGRCHARNMPPANQSAPAEQTLSGQVTQIPGQAPPNASIVPEGTVNAPTAEDRADVYFAQGRFQAAIAAYKQVAPATAPSLNKMGMSYQKMYQTEEAKKCYEAATKMEPKNVSYLNNLGTVYQGLRQYGNAEKIYRRALKIDPRNALIYKNLGTLYLAQGKIGKGKHCYEEAAKIDPNIFTSRATMSVDEPADVHNRGAMNYFMARSCMQAGMTECAISYLRAALGQNYTTAKKLASDPEFERLRGVYAFQQMLAEQDAKLAQTPTK